jgi:hypothetical protein
MNNTNTPFFKTTRDSINHQQNILNGLMRDYDKWAGRNPDKIIICKKGDPDFEKAREFREFKQQIKLCKLRINELQELEKKHLNTPTRLR